MLIVAIKLFATPLLIWSVTLAGRRWGSSVSGLLIGLPLITGPISFILTSEFGTTFGARVASGNLAGEISICSFCLIYYHVSKHANWFKSVSSALIGFVLTTYLLHFFEWTPIPAFLALTAAIALSAKFMPQRITAKLPASPPAWDLPLRMFVAIIFVIAITSISDVLGPQLSGLISTFPIFATVFTVFTQRQQGPAAAGNLLRGIVLSAASYAIFFMMIGLGLPKLGISLTYFLAVLFALCASFFFHALGLSSTSPPGTVP
jgi:hypothetical protein